jgi:tRNA(Ile)-lysidine synthase
VKSLTQAFLDVHWDRTRPLLLGYSGGPDSKALLYALLECGVVPHLAHVDHGWREESALEAETLRAEAAKLGCPFHTVRLALKGKREEEAREGRFAFFRSLLPAYQALLLAHQADDLAETVLKRVLEGSHLPFCGGMEAVSRQFDLVVWRPFLTIRRSETLQFLEERGLSPLVDPSNADPVYLRSRMRGEIFPFLNEKFGKETTENLVLLSERAAELRAYLDRRVAHARIHRGPWGTLIECEGLERIERRHLLQKIAREEAIVFSRPVLETLLNWIEEEGKAKHLAVQTKKIWVDQGKVFVISFASKDSISIA